MAAHRYWRLRAIPYNAGGYLAYASLTFHETENGGDVSGSGTPIADSQYGGYGPANAFDGNTGTQWITGAGVGVEAWCGIDFGAGNEKDIAKVTVLARQGSYQDTGPGGPGTSGYSALGLSYIDYSDNGTNWTNAWAAIRRNRPEAYYNDTAWAFLRPDGSKKLWRILVTETVNPNDALQAQEIEFRVGGAAQSGLPFSNVNALSAYQPQADRAFDGNTSTSANFNNKSGPNGATRFVGLQFYGTGPAIDSIMWRSVRYATAPKNLSIQSSTDGGATWTEAWAVADTGTSTDWGGETPTSRVFVGPTASVAKVVGYAVVAPLADQIHVPKVVGYAAVIPPANNVHVAKVVSYAVIAPPTETAVPVDGAMAGSAAFAADLSVRRALTGDVAASVTPAAILGFRLPLTGNVSASATPEASASQAGTWKLLWGGLIGSAEMLGEISLRSPLVGTMEVGATFTAAELDVFCTLAGNMAAGAVLAGDLTLTATPVDPLAAGERSVPVAIADEVGVPAAWPGGQYTRLCFWNPVTGEARIITVRVEVEG